MLFRIMQICEMPGATLHPHLWHVGDSFPSQRLEVLTSFSHKQLLGHGSFSFAFLPRANSWLISNGLQLLCKLTLQEDVELESRLPCEHLSHTTGFWGT